MKRTRQREIEYCDKCDKEYEYGYHCIRCGKYYCHDCRAEMGQEFESGVYSRGNDGFFCFACLAEKESWGSSRYGGLLRAFLVIQALRRESKTMWDEFSKRQEEAEGKLKSLIEKQFGGRLR